MAKEKKLIITEWIGDENADDRTYISFEYKCPNCGYINDCISNSLKGNDGVANCCERCDDILIFKFANNRIEAELKPADDKIQLTAHDVTVFYDWILDTCEDEDLDFNEFLKEFNFDKAECDKVNLESLSPEKIFSLYEYMVYMVLNGLVGGDFGTMYDILIDTLGLNAKIADELLSF